MKDETIEYQVVGRRLCRNGEAEFQAWRNEWYPPL